MKDWTINLEDLKEFSKKFEKQNDVHVPDLLPNTIQMLKKGGGIHIKKANRGKFTSYCGGKVTNECIAKGKNSPDPKVRKRATFAANSRKWKH